MGNEIVLKCKTISKVCISPRASQALYETLDYKQSEENQNYNMIYPFYSYDDRHLKEDYYLELKKKVSFYVPASSIKGALLLKENEGKYFRLDDAKLDSKDIETCNIYKFQYVNILEEDVVKAKKENEGEKIKSPKYDIFFPNVGLEMLSESVSFDVKVQTVRTYNSSLQMEAVLKRLNEHCVKKLERYIMKLDALISYFEYYVDAKLVEDTAGFNKLKMAKESIMKLKNQYTNHRSGKSLIFLGGFKGHLMANEKIENKEVDEQFPKSAFYFVECQSKELLPYGILEVSIE